MSLHWPSHPHVPHPADYESWQTRMADRVSGAFGTMTTFWLLVGWQITWMTVATLGVWPFKYDPYPFVFLLFLGNLVQLWGMPVLGTATNRADQKRAAKADADHQALSYIAAKVDAIEANQNKQTGV